MHALAEISARNGNAEHTIRCLTDFPCIQDPFRTFERRHEKGPPLLNAKFLLRRADMFFDTLHIVCALTFCNAHPIRTAGDTDADIFLPVRRLEPVHADKHLSLAVINAPQRMIEREARRILLVLRHRILKVENNAVHTVDIGILNQARTLRIHEHHRTAETESLRSWSWNHWTAPPHGTFLSDIPALRKTAHSTRARIVQSRAP